MKNLRFLLWGLALATLTACVDLDEQLVGTVTTTYFSTPAGLEAAVDGDYAQLRDFFGREESFAVTEFGTDLTTNGDQGGYQFENTYAAGLNASAGHYRFPWDSFYRGINTSNTVIERAPAVTGMDPAVKASRIAEAKFLRALSYFWLVQMYGPAPLPLTESQGASNVAHRAPVDSVYLQIVKDLREAIPDLPVTQSQVGRATQGAARHLLAKVLLTRAYHPYSYEAANTDFYLSSPAFLREPGDRARTATCPPTRPTPRSSGPCSSRPRRACSTPAAATRCSCRCCRSTTTARAWLATATTAAASAAPGPRCTRAICCSAGPTRPTRRRWTRATTARSRACGTPTGRTPGHASRPREPAGARGTPSAPAAPAACRRSAPTAPTARRSSSAIRPSSSPGTWSGRRCGRR